MPDPASLAVSSLRNKPSLTDKTSEEINLAPARPAERTTLDRSRSAADPARSQWKPSRALHRANHGPLHQRICDFDYRGLLLIPVLLPEIGRQRVNISIKTRPDEPLGV